MHKIVNTDILSSPINWVMIYAIAALILALSFCFYVLSGTDNAAIKRSEHR